MILFRVDSGSFIGSGHIGRCSRLAMELQKIGHQVAFVSRPNPGHVLEFLREGGIEVVELPYEENGNEISNDPSSWLPGGPIEDARALRAVIELRKWDVKLLVIDHYAISSAWEALFYNEFPLLAFDDLGVEEHKVNLLIHQNIDTEIARFIGLKNPAIPLWSGVTNILLGSDLLDLKLSKRVLPSFPPKRVIVFFGGFDPEQISLKVAGLLKEENLDFTSVLVIAGGANGRVEAIKSAVKGDSRFEVAAFSKNFYEELAECDFFIGAGGSSSYERCLLGIPSLTLAIADNQVPFAKKLGADGATVYLGRSEDVSIEVLSQRIRAVWRDESSYRRMSLVSQELFAEAKGARDVAKRICEHFRL